MKLLKSELKEIIQEAVFDLMTEKLCARGKAYIAARKRAGEKSSAYLSGRAVKVCKGQIKGAGGKRKKSYRNEGDDAAMKKSALGMAMYGKKAKMNELEVADNTEFKIALKHLLQKHATNLRRGDDDTEFKLTLKHLLDKHVVKGGEEKAD